MTSVAFVDVDFRYPRGAWLLKGLTLEIAAGDAGHVACLVGASGSGKTTLLRMIAGSIRPQSGRVQIIDGGDVLSYLPQDVVLFDHLSLMENARYFSRIRATRPLFSEEHFTELADKLELKRLLLQRGSLSEMSGGERQRLALLRALSIRPRLLLLDEPCVGLDVPIKHEFLRLLKAVVEEYRILAIYVTHHPDEVKILSDSVAFLTRESEGAPAVVLQKQMDELLAMPPTRDIAKFFGEPTLNTLRCDVDGNQIVVGESRSVIGQTNSSEIPASVAEMGFDPECVEWTTVGGCPLTICGRSTQYWFFSPEGLGLLDTLTGLRTDIAPMRFRVRGSVFLFDPTGRNLGRIVLE